VRDRILAAVAGHPASEVTALGDHFLPGLAAKLRPAMSQALADHADQGHDRVVLSASPTEIVSRFADMVGMDLGIGTTAARDEDGVYTGVLAGPFCYREGKVEVMRQLARERGYDLAQCYAYSDSASDMPMLEAVGHPVAVNPEPELREIAEKRGWPIIETSSLPRVSLRSWPTIVRFGRSLASNATAHLRRTTHLRRTSRTTMAA
jgi:HAD superfamily hydrolase (TIGR01490 family)